MYERFDIASLRYPRGLMSVGRELEPLTIRVTADDRHPRLRLTFAMCEARLHMWDMVGCEDYTESDTAALSSEWRGNTPEGMIVAVDSRYPESL
jgi:hypothetical protein